MNYDHYKQLNDLVMSYVYSIPVATSVEAARYMVFMAKMLSRIAAGEIADE